MGRYTTRPVSNEEYKQIIDTLRSGYTHEGINHRPNVKVATALQIECNLGIRLSDVLNLTTESIIRDGNVWRLNITEIKTDKARTFVVPDAVKQYIDNYCAENHITGRIFKFSEEAVWNALRPLTAYLGLKHVSTHSCRKASAMRLYEATGHDIVKVKQFLQHSSSAITDKYLSYSEESMQASLSEIVNIV